MTQIIDKLFDLFHRFGTEGYGEALSLEQHMLQSAAVAQSNGASDSLIVAALLHDIGYFIAAEGAAQNPGYGEINFGDDHEAIGSAWLSQAFSEDVTAPIALHVEAKRYLCRVDVHYCERLSQASRDSLALQGGPKKDGEVAEFTNHPAFEASLRLRRWDDSGKATGLATPTLETFRSVLVATTSQAS